MDAKKIFYTTHTDINADNGILKQLEVLSSQSSFQESNLWA